MNKKIGYDFIIKLKIVFNRSISIKFVIYKLEIIAES